MGGGTKKNPWKGGEQRSKKGWRSEGVGLKMSYFFSGKVTFTMEISKKDSDNFVLTVTIFAHEKKNLDKIAFFACDKIAVAIFGKSNCLFACITFQKNCS